MRQHHYKINQSQNLPICPYRRVVILRQSIRLFNSGKYRKAGSLILMMPVRISLCQTNRSKLLSRCSCSQSQNYPLTEKALTLFHSYFRVNLKPTNSQPTILALSSYYIFCKSLKVFFYSEFQIRLAQRI